jgi:hypothetical protein
MQTWIDSYRSSYAVGSTVPTVSDCSGKYRTIAQANAAKQPAIEIRNGIKSFRFVDDCLQTSVLTLGGKQVSLLVVMANVVAVANAIIAEAGPTIVGTLDSIVFARQDALANNFASAFFAPIFPGPGTGLWYYRTTSAYATWVNEMIMADKSLPAAGEIVGYMNNQTPATATTPFESNNTFGNYIWNIGSRNNALSGKTDGCIAELVVFNRTFNAYERTDLYRSMQEIVGLAWTS